MQELEKILEELAKHIFIAEVYNDDFNGTTINNLICLGDVREVLEDHMNDGWIPVEKELPPNAKHRGALCPKYQVMTKYGVTEGWYNPDCESWFCLFWFVDSEFTEAHIDFEHGDVPKRVKIEKGVEIVLAWRPLPAPYMPEKTEHNPQPDWRDQFMKRFERVE